MELNKTQLRESEGSSGPLEQGTFCVAKFQSSVCQGEDVAATSMAHCDIHPKLCFDGSRLSLSFGVGWHWGRDVCFTDLLPFNIPIDSRQSMRLNNLQILPLFREALQPPFYL